MTTTRRSLVLKREALAELSEADLTGVAGAGGIRITESGYSCGIRPCNPFETLFCQFDTFEGC